ncbi:hypothetical protein ELOC111193_03555 [Elizabethkingia occulta]|uniref:DUF308 domain-containing protein n=1 Tax=Elizabethkingia occulta TaxID=1867263 RepID=A0A1T3MBY5_9FLAO|nr:hypothetical protein [Elizabethkingia occulta]OPB92719.1 hypothetical protein BB020_09000 [Elizabethkingia occulta]OPC62044.1 hypothetical protein BAZ10_09275 [Elizabethkingia occulta]
MPTSFNTHIKSAVKSIYLPFITGSLNLATGILLLLSNLHYMEFCGGLFALSGLSMSIFTLRNYKILNGWGGYLLFAVLILTAGGYTSLYKTSYFFMGWVALLRSGVLFGAALDFKRLGHKGWRNISIAGGISLLFSVILIADPETLHLPTHFVLAVIFMTTGTASLLIFSELKKVNEFHGLLRKLMKNA